MKIEIDKSIFEHFPELESERLFYRNILEEDRLDIFDIRSNDEVMKFMDKFKMVSVEDSEKFINSIIKTYKNKNGINWGIVEKSSNKLIGYFGFWKIIEENCRAEIGYALIPKFWHKGYMTEAMKTIIPFGFNKIKLHSIEANVNADNENSIKLLEKLGFKKEAYFRENYLFNNKFIDSVIYSLLNRDFIKILK